MSQSTSSISEKELKRREFILHGNLWKVVFIIALPLFFYSLFNYAYSIIDTIMCSGLSKEALNAVGALNQANNMISAIGTGLGAGGSILIAREIGKGDYQKAKRWSNTVFFYVFIIAALTISIVLPLTTPLLRLLNIAEESIEIGSRYFMVSVCSSAVVMINTIYMGVEKAHGSTLPITLLNVGVVVIKVILNVIFIYALQLKDMMFVSLATLIANSSLTVFILIRLFFTNYIFRFDFRDISFKGNSLKRVTFISFPIFLGKFIFSLGKVVINGFAKEFGSDVVGALGVSNNMGGAVTNPLSSIEDSTSSIISQNLGAKQIDRAIKTFYVGLAYNLSLAIIGVVLVTIFDKPITMFFARSADNVEEYASYISQVFFYEKMGIITLAINSSVLGFLYGFGKTRIASLINIARVFVFRIPSFLICNALLANGVQFPGVGKENPGFMVAGISMGASNIAIGLVAIVVIIVEISRLKKKMKVQEESMTLNEEERQTVDSFIQQFLKGYQPYKGGTWCYEDGVVLNGSYQMYKATKDPFYLDFCVRYFDEHISEDGSLKGFKIENYNLDDLEPGYALYLVNKIHHEEKYDKALQLMEGQFKVQIRLNNGAFIHKSRYPGQLWLDGLFMANPFYALYANGEHSLTMLEDVKKQFENVDKFNVDPTSGQYRHCYDENKFMQWADKSTGRSPHVWLRSVGWLAMADCDVYEVVHESMVGKFTAGFYKKQLKSVLDSLKPYEDENHMYYDLPLLKDENGNYPETSGSLMFAYGYMKGSRLGMLPYEERKHGCEIFEGVVRNYLKEGHLKNICKVSGLDNERRNGTIAYYLSEPIVDDDSKGVGPFMMAYSEYLAKVNS
jgi:putative MATE family efflux protein